MQETCTAKLKPHINILVPDVCCVVGVWPEGIHPLDCVVCPIRVQGVVVVLDPLFNTRIEELLRYFSVRERQPRIGSCMENATTSTNRYASVFRIVLITVVTVKIRY